MQTKWFTFNDAGRRRWTVWLCDHHPVDDEGRQCLGLTNFERREILLSIRQSSAELVDTVMHEFVHAAGGIRPRSPVLALAEESVARRSEKGLWAILTSLGFRLPPLPDGFMALRKPKGKRAA